MRALIVVLMLASVASAELKLAESQKDKIRSGMAKQHKENIRLAKLELQRLIRTKAGKLVPQQKELIAKLEKCEVVVPPVMPDPIEVGHFGMIGPQVEVLNVVNENEVLVLVQTEDVLDRQYLWLKGRGTKEVTSGQKLDMLSTWYASGTTTYKTVLGGSKTVLVLEAIELGEYNPKPAEKTTGTKKPAVKK